MTIAGVRFKGLYSHGTLLKSKGEGTRQIVWSHIKDSQEDAFPKRLERRVNGKGIPGKRIPSSRSWTAGSSGLNRERQPRGRASEGD